MSSTMFRLIDGTVDIFLLDRTWYTRTHQEKRTPNIIIKPTNKAPKGHIYVANVQTYIIIIDENMNMTKYAVNASICLK